MTYQDVPLDHTYRKAIEFVSTHGIMLGDHNGNFNPNAHVLCSDLCVIVVNLFFFDFQKYDPNKLITASTFIPYRNICLKKGLITEEFANQINENNPCLTDAKIADLLYVFNQAKTTIFQLPTQSHFSTSDKFINKEYITRDRCAYFIYLFIKYVSREVGNCILQTDTLEEIQKYLSLIDKFDWIREFTISDIHQICMLLKPSKYYPSLCEQIDIFMFMKEICNLKQKFSYHGSEPLYHYTSLYALEKLTSSDAQFHLSNTAYLNDPQEGLLGMKKLSKRSVVDPVTHTRWYPIPKSSLDVFVHPSFIASFMTKGDLLPMWVQYGSGGSGCCLEFAPDDISEPLYSVTYSAREINSFFSKILDHLKLYQKKYLINKFNSDPVFQYARNVLEQGCYLYKDSSYKHEKEVRILTFAPFSNAKAELAPRENEAFPRIYLETPLEHNRKRGMGLNFSSITLGPTVPNPERIATALAQRGYDTSIIKKSTIKFR